MDGFSLLAEKYDTFNTADYDGYTRFADEIFRQHGKNITEVLDLGCGTGELSLRLADMGYSVSAVDNSEEMLSLLEGKIGSRDIDIRAICQDIRELDLFGTVRGCVSSFDVLNYLPGKKDLEKVFGRVGLFMEEGGVFVFDVNTDYSYRQIYSANTYTYEDKNSFLIWRNEYNDKTRVCRFFLTKFELQKPFRGVAKELYIREDSVQTQKNHSPSTLLAAAKKAGFDIAAVYGDTQRSPQKPTDPKAYYVLIKNRKL